MVLSSGSGRLRCAFWDTTGENLKAGRFHSGVRSHKLFMVLKNLPAKTCSLKVHSFVPRKARLSSFGSLVKTRPGQLSPTGCLWEAPESMAQGWSQVEKQFVAKN